MIRTTLITAFVVTLAAFAIVVGGIIGQSIPGWAWAGGILAAALVGMCVLARGDF